MDELVAEATAERRFQTLLLSVFSGAALVLSLVGLYALQPIPSAKDRGLRDPPGAGAQQRDVMHLIMVGAQASLSQAQRWD